jgi:hypothetical protein
VSFALGHLPAWSADGGVGSLLHAWALACPNCATGQLARASVFEDRFWDHLFVIGLPAVILGLITALLYRVGLGETTFTPRRADLRKEST